MFDSLAKVFSVNTIPVPKYKPRACVKGKRFYDLLGCPEGTGILCDVEMEDLSITVSKNNEYVEYAISNAGHGEEVDCCDLVSMIQEKGPPSL